MGRVALWGACGVLACLAGPAAAQVRIVAAENVYGDVARQIGGSSVAVVSILNNPDEDPHLFEASASVARALASAAIVVQNGAAYDPWLDKLLVAHEAPGRIRVIVAELVGRKAGDNPHLWYDPATMRVFAKALAGALDRVDPSNKQEHARRLAAFHASLAHLDAKVATMGARYAGKPIAATEPVFGYMAAALGLAMRNEPFQRAVMNATEPSAAQVAAFEDDLRQHAVAALVYNSQASDAAATRLRRIALKSGVPVVGVSETAPPGTAYQDWMTSQLDALDRALSGTAP